MIIYLKDPNATKDYGWDWSAFLGGDTILTSVWTSSSVNITLSAGSNTATTTTIWLSGGTLTGNYLITNRITTAAGRIDDRTFRVIIKEQ